MTRTPAFAPAMFSAPILAPILALILSACVTGYGPGRTANVLNGGLRVGMAAGYCIDQAASRESGDSAVILMGRCNTNVTETPAVLSLSIGPAASGGAITGGNAALAAFFQSSEGRATLSRNGKASEVEIIEAFDSNGIFTMRVRDKAVGEYWRAVTALRGRIVTLSASGTESTPLEPAAGRALLAKAMAEMVKANSTPQA